VQAVLKAAGWPGSDEDWVLIAGHQPDLGAVAAYLLGTEGSLSMKKAGIWWFSNRARALGDELVLRAVITPDLL
jgi:phosphohistidine phosphatase